MERAEKVGLGIAAAGHVLLLAVLSIGLVPKAKLLPPLKSEPMDVVLVDAIGLRSAAPKAASEAPAPSEAPSVAKPEEAVAPNPAPPEPAPAPAPAPKPAPPKAAATQPAPPEPVPPKPAPPKPVPPTPPKPEPKSEPKPKPTVRPVPKPAPAKPAAKPTPEKTQPDKVEPDRTKPEKAAPEKTKPRETRPAKAVPNKTSAAKAAPAKAAPAKAAPAKAAPTSAVPAKPSKADVAATGDTRDRGRPDRPTDGGGAPSPKSAKPAGGKPGDKPTKPAGSRLGPDFLKGITPEKVAGKATKPAAASVSALAVQGLAGTIKRQVQPCYDLGSLQGTPAMSIVTTLRLRFNRDGTVSAAPTVSEHTGVNGSNQSYVRQIDDVAIRAVRRCAPLKLPAGLYEGGWEDIEFRFVPGQLG